MNLLVLYDKQKALDEHIFLTKNHTRENTLGARILAATIELAEIANEVRSFKFWSNKGLDFDKAKEEYVDVLHFLLSIGIDLDCRIKTVSYVKEEFETTTLFLKLFELFSILNQKRDKKSYQELMVYFFTLGKHLNFSEELIESEYLRKHEINYERQKNGY